MNVEDELPISNQFTIEYTSLTLTDHVRRCFLTTAKHYPIAIALFGIIWGGIEAAVYMLELDLVGVRTFVFALASSALLWVAYGANKYFSDPPTGFESFPNYVQSTVRFMLPYWEARLAAQLLEREIDSHLKRLDELSTGILYVRKTKKPSIQEYVNWVQLRIPNLMSMIEVAQHLLIVELPNSLRRIDGQQTADPVKIRDVVSTIGRFYIEVVNFELDHATVVPPERLETLHSTLEMWTGPMYEFASDMLVLLEDIGKGEHSAGSAQFTIEILTPDALEAFEQEMRKLEPNLNNLMMEEMGL